MLSVHDSPALIEQALNAERARLPVETLQPDELIAAVRTVAAGGCYLTPDIAMKLAAGRQDPLTKRERQVAEKAGAGHGGERDCPPSSVCRRKPSTYTAPTCWKSWASATTLSWRAACSIAGNEGRRLTIAVGHRLRLYLRGRLVLPVEHQSASGGTRGFSGAAVSFGLRLGLMLQCPRGYWPVLLGTEVAAYLMAGAGGGAGAPIILMTGSLLTLLPVALISRYRQQRD